ncbi:hypothetical protein G7067_04360 [Leucobacter insecticola]|uniref:Bacterial Ig domain-containing protein n=1 Tax=Leucobacter insecticola TaxID=2714934 RepID=A0A6G8FHI1_9MICO|nr:hypothetical protein G7067_04360 [Leucobacter insecticola]
MPLTISSSIGEVSGLTYLGDGVYTAQLRSTTPGIAVITAALDGEAVDAMAEIELINRIPPTAPVLDPSDGKTVTGCAAPGSTVTVRDAEGNVIGTAVAGDDCRFEIELNPEQKPGSSITVTATDRDGNESIATELRSGLITLELGSASLHPGETQVATGHFFQPGEKVTAVLRSTPVTIGEETADANGDVRFEFAVPTDIELGEHSVTLSGDFSGDVRQTFQVTAAPGLAITGGQSMLLLGGAAILILAVGGALVVVARRRRASE